MKMDDPQQYCLRWNNHQANLVSVFADLFNNDNYADCTLACDNGMSIKCHKVVLAACSPYFSILFNDLPVKHPVIVLKDVKYPELRAILEYMYRGEVNVAGEQLTPLMEVAEALKVKGLVDENGLIGKSSDHDNSRHYDSSSPPPRIGTSSATLNSIPSSSISPSHSNGDRHSPVNSKPYHPYKNHDRRGGISLPWPMQAPTSTHHAAAAAAMLSCYDSADSPLRRKKLQSLLMSRDTPILRTVLGQGQPDSTPSGPLIARADSHERIHYNGNSHDIDRNLPLVLKKLALSEASNGCNSSLSPGGSPFPYFSSPTMKAEPSEDAISPYTDASTMDEESSPNDKSMKSMPGSSPQSQADARGVSSGIAPYVPQQKPEWKRYKQYTRNDILSAIEAVRNGMSALQAARKYGVPSRTLYDKVKKLGITTTRLFKRGANGGSTPNFPYSMNMFGIKNENEESLPPHSSSSLLEPMFLQQALERGKADYPDREALMALASAHAQAVHSTPNSGHNSSPEYKWHGNGNGSGSMTPSPNEANMDDEDQVEDLSVNRKEPQHPTGSVIVPLMSHFIKTEEERSRIEMEEMERERDRLLDEKRTRLDNDRTDISREIMNNGGTPIDTGRRD